MAKHKFTASACGCLIGGIVVPIAFFLVAGVILHDLGGPLFWPLLCIAGGVSGALLGCFIAIVARYKLKKRKDGKQKSK